MRCRDAAERLPLYVEGDLPPAVGEGVKAHLARCAACRRLCQRLLESQSAFKSLRREALDPSAVTEARRQVLALIDSSGNTAGWALRTERFLVTRFRRQPYVLAGVGLALVAASLYGLFGLTGDHAAPEFASHSERATASSGPEPVETLAGMPSPGTTDAEAVVVADAVVDDDAGEAIGTRAVADPVVPAAPEAVDQTIGLTQPDWGTDRTGPLDGAAGPGSVDVAPEPQAEQVLVRVVTDHPDLIIYWLIDGKGDGV